MADALSSLFVELGFKVSGAGDLKSVAHSLKLISARIKETTSATGKLVSAFKHVAVAAKEAASAIESVPAFKAVVPAAVSKPAVESAATQPAPAVPPRATPVVPTEPKEAFKAVVPAAVSKPAVEVAATAPAPAVPPRATPVVPTEAQLPRSVSEERKQAKAEQDLRRKAREEERAERTRAKAAAAEKAKEEAKSAVQSTNWLKTLKVARNVVSSPSSGLISAFVSLRTKAAGIAVAAAAIVSAIAKATIGAAELGRELGNIRLATDINTDSLQNIGFAAGQAGVSAGGLADALAQVQSTMAQIDFGEGLPKSWGYLQIAPQMGALNALERVRQKIHEEDRKGNLAMINRTREMVRQAGFSTEIYNFLRRTNVELKDLRGPSVMTEEELSAGFELASAWSRMTQSWGLLWDKFGATVAPVISTLLDDISTLLGFIIKGFDLISKLGKAEPAAVKDARLKGVSGMLLGGNTAALRVAAGAVDWAFGTSPQKAVSSTVNNNIAPSVTINAKTDNPMELARIVNGVVVNGYDEAFRQANQAATGNPNNRP